MNPWKYSDTDVKMSSTDSSDSFDEMDIPEPTKCVICPFISYVENRDVPTIILGRTGATSCNTWAVKRKMKFTFRVCMYLYIPKCSTCIILPLFL